MGLLIVDDDSLSLGLLTHHLRDQEGELFTAKSVAECLKLVPSLENKIDAIFLDYNLGDGSGFDLCVKLRENFPWLHLVPILIVTADTNSDSISRAFKSGASDYIRKPIDRAELLARLRLSLKMKSEMEIRIRRESELTEMTHLLRALNQNLEHISTVDALTQVANRRRFDEYLQVEWGRATRMQQWLSLILIDIDHFKKLNDAEGHQAGDHRLIEVAHELKKTLRRPSDMIARYGGEEFAAILPATDLSGAMILAERIRKNIEALGAVTVSLGVAAVIPLAQMKVADFLKSADQALYSAKAGGRNQVAKAASF